MTTIYPDKKPEPIQLTADDWVADRSTPVIAITWNGSYLGYGYEACDCNQSNVPKPLRPDRFLITIRDHDAVTNLPGQILWEYETHKYDEVMTGYDRNHEKKLNEAVFRYSLRLLEHCWFKPSDKGIHYWLTITAVYERSKNKIPYLWGWTSHEHVFEGAFHCQTLLNNSRYYEGIKI